jgi:hypothetical protein
VSGSCPNQPRPRAFLQQLSNTLLRAEPRVHDMRMLCKVSPEGNAPFLDDQFMERQCTPHSLIHGSSWPFMALHGPSWLFKAWAVRQPTTEPITVEARSFRCLNTTVPTARAPQIIDCRVEPALPTQHITGPSNNDLQLQLHARGDRLIHLVEPPLCTLACPAKLFMCSSAPSQVL